MSNQKINILCACGSDKFNTPQSPISSDTITCAKCGAQEKYGILQRKVASKVHKQIEADFKKMLKKAGFK